MRKIYLFAVIFALIAGVATYFFVNSLQHNSAVTGVQEADVLIAVEDIAENTIVTSDMFQVIRMPVSSITYGTLVNAQEVNGYMATEKIRKGEQVLASKLTDLREGDTNLESNGEYRLSYHLGEGKYAYTIAVGETNTVALFLRAGDYINIYDRTADDASNPILRNIRVLEIGTYSDYKMVKTGIETTTYTLVTLSVTEKQIETLVKIWDVDGNARIALVPYAEGASLVTTTTEPVTDEEGNVIPEDSLKEPQTNVGMGEITTAAPTTEAAS